jgi:hypothetical protein
VEGIFRLSGSSKRIKELQLAFDSPPRYGKGLDWTGYTVHDAANILRRYLNMLPEPIVPHEKYENFRDPLRSHQAEAVGDMEAQAQSVGEFDPDVAISSYQKLITELPPLNRQLLLYILDLLAVFAAKSELNRMTSPNLAAIFQPGMLSHPGHDMVPAQYRLSQDVIIFLIVNQDHFLVGMRGTAADADTVRDIQRGSPRQPNTSARTSQAGLGRSSSNASAGADSLRRQGGLRRNVSVSSRGSRASSNVPSPGSPGPGSPLTTTTSGGVHRSNTVPSQRSPGIPSGRFRNPEPSSPTTSRLAPSGQLASAARSLSSGSRLAEPTYEASSFNAEPSVTTAPVTPTADTRKGLVAVSGTRDSDNRTSSRDNAPSTEGVTLRTLEHGVTTTISSGNSPTPNRERKSLFSKSPSSENERSQDDRKPNKLRKKRVLGVSPNASAQSSTQSLHDSPNSPTAFYTPMPTPGMINQLSGDPLNTVPSTLSDTDASLSSEIAPRIGEMDKLSSFRVSQGSTNGGSPALKPAKSPPQSLHSKGSVTEESELDHTNDATSDNKTQKKRRWRLSSSTAKPSNQSNERRAVTPSGSRLGSSAIAEMSATSVASQGRPKKSMTNDTLSTQTGTEASASLGLHHSSNESTPSKEPLGLREKDSGPEDEKKKGPMSWIKGKVAKAKEKKEEREAEKERAKSPPRNGDKHARSEQSLDAIAQEGLPTRGRSTDAIAEVSREEEAQPAAPIGN